MKNKSKHGPAVLRILRRTLSTARRCLDFAGGSLSTARRRLDFSDRPIGVRFVAILVLLSLAVLLSFLFQMLAFCCCCQFAVAVILLLVIHFVVVFCWCCLCFQGPGTGPPNLTSTPPMNSKHGRATLRLLISILSMAGPRLEFIGGVDVKFEGRTGPSVGRFGGRPAGPRTHPTDRVM